MKIGAHYNQKPNKTKTSRQISLRNIKNSLNPINSIDTKSEHAWSMKGVRSFVYRIRASTHQLHSKFHKKAKKRILFLK